MEMFVQIVLGACFILGPFLHLTAGIGILKFPNFLVRLHSTSKASTLGVGFILIGVMIKMKSWDVSIKMATILFFVFLTSSIVAHLFAKAYLVEWPEERK
jgi:multicomponent Na+:H+ antiporter subunit G